MSKKSHTSSSQQNPAVLNPQKDFSLIKYLVDHISDELMLIDSKGRIVYVNQATVKGLGFTKDQLFRKSILELYKEPMSLRDWQRQYFFELRRNRKPIHYQIDRIIKAGKVQTIEVSAVYIKFNGDEYILSIGRDITAQIQIQNKLKESEDLYRLLSEGAGDAILTCNLKGEITYANRATSKLLNTSLLNIKGAHFKKFMASESLAKVWRIFAQAKKGVSGITEELFLLSRDKRKIPVEVTVSPLYSDEKIIQIQGIVRDITKRKQLEQLVVENETRRALFHFVSGSAQEINNPLKQLYERIQVILQKYKNRDFEYIGFREFTNIMDSLQVISKQIKYCSDTTNQLVSLYTKKIGLEDLRCPVNDSIREVLHSFDQQLKLTNIRQRFSLTKNLPLAAINILDFNQVINNIVSNAIQAMPAGGLLSVRTFFKKKAKEVMVIIKDDGVGIPKENLSHVFEPFFTTQQRGVNRSAGLGLSIVHSIIKSYKGQIFIRSDLRTGTIVTISIPIAKGKR